MENVENPNGSSLDSCLSIGGEVLWSNRKVLIITLILIYSIIMEMIGAQSIATSVIEVVKDWPAW